MPADRPLCEEVAFAAMAPHGATDRRLSGLALAAPVFHGRPVSKTENPYTPFCKAVLHEQNSHFFCYII